MSEIPEGVHAVATGIANDIPSRVTDTNRAFAALVIARAILAERKRCAEIARCEERIRRDAQHPMAERAAYRIAQCIEATT